MGVLDSLQREVRLPSYIENIQSNDDLQSVIEIYRPIRQSVYAILHNLNKHLYDCKKLAEERGKTVSRGNLLSAVYVVERCC